MYKKCTGLNINEAVSLYYSIIDDIIDLFIPKIIKRHCYYPVWYSKNLKELIFKKKIDHKYCLSLKL